MSQRAPPRTKDTFLLRAEKDDPGMIHIVEIVDRNISNKALCGNEVDWGKPIHFAISATTCNSCRDAAEALGVL